MNPTRTLLALAVLGLAGCTATGPALTPATVPVAPAFANASAGTEPVAAFWRGFNDPALDALVDQALKANGDLRLAASRLRESRAAADFADAQALPSVDASVAAQRARARDDQGVAQTASGYSAGFDMRWELDLFGRVAGDQRAAAADVAARQALLRATQVSLAAEVARQYFELRGLQERRRVAEQSLTTQREALVRVELRQQVGRGTALDTARAQALVQGTAAELPALEAALARTRYRLAVLTGQAPTALDSRLAEVRPLPGLPPTALSAIGSPESLLRRRPDISAAQAQLDAAAARAGVARADWFPRVTLAGTLGLTGGRLSALTDSDALAWNLGAQLLWNLFDGGRLRAQIAAADARGEQAVIQYEQTVLAALEETEGALAAYTRGQQQVTALAAATRAAQQASDIARARLEAGTIDFLVVLDAERELLGTRANLAQTQTATATALVAVYKALAGGWGETATP